MTQAITLRLITHQAGGGEIIRTRHIETGEAMIGRSPDCEIHLTDLAVDREHAILRVTGQNRVSIDSLTGEPFLVDGKPSLNVALEISKPPVITFGDYDLVLALGGEDDIAITVLRREDDHHATPSLFSLKADIFGRRKMAWSFVLAILALCLIVPMGAGFYGRYLHIHPDQQWSTGALSKAHAFLDKDCQACHQQAFVAVRDQACKACHLESGDAADVKRIDAKVAGMGSPFLPLLIAEHAPHDKLVRATPPPPTLGGKVKGVFQFAFNHPDDRCASCHLEHTGPKPDPNLPANADIVRPGRPTLVLVNDCASCHSQLKMRLPSTQLIDTPDWSRHPDFRPLVTVGFDGAQPRFERIALSDKPQEINGLTFSHRIHMDPGGGVARQGEVLGAGRGYGGALTCQSCHRADGGGFKPLEMERDCGACHSLAFGSQGGQLQTLRHHDMRNIPGVLAASASGGPTIEPAVLRRAMAPGGLCVDCHTINPSNGPFGGQIAPVHLADRVMPWGDFNHAVPAHAGQGAGAAACADCHKATTSDHASDVLLSGISTCGACHGKTEHQTPAAASAQCATCHGFHHPGRAPATPQDRTLAAAGSTTGGKPRGMLAF